MTDAGGAEIRAQLAGLVSGMQTQLILMRLVGMVAERKRPKITRERDCTLSVMVRKIAIIKRKTFCQGRGSNPEPQELQHATYVVWEALLETIGGNFDFGARVTASTVSDHRFAAYAYVTS